MKIGKKISSNKIGKKMKRAAFIGGKGGIVLGRALQDTGAIMSVVGGPEGVAVGVPAMAIGKGVEVASRMVKNAGQGKSISRIERRAVKDLTSMF